MNGIVLPSQVEIATALYGCWRMFLGDEDAASYFRKDVDGFWSGAWAIVLAIPALLLAALLGLDYSGGPPPGIAALVIEGEVLILSVTLYAWAMLGITRAMEREARYLNYMIAFFWISMVKIYLWVLAAILALGLGLPTAGAQVLQIGVFSVSIWLSWFMTRVTLDVNGGQAAIVVFGTFFYTTLFHAFLA